MKKKKFVNSITNELKNKTVLITGGAGSIGTALTKKNPRLPSKICKNFRYR